VSHAAIAAALVSCVLAGTAQAATVSAPLGMQADSSPAGTFCTTAPTELDRTVPAVVNALDVAVPDTPPIAVLDTGVDGSVPELAGRIVDPFDALSGNPDAADVDGHGTSVAGLAAGAPGLVQGVSPTSPVMPIRIFNRYSDTSMKSLVAGIQWAVAHGAKVINISASSPLSEVGVTDVADVSRAVLGAFNAGVLVVSAVGNDGEDRADFPSSLPHVLAVGAIDSTGTRAPFSDTGPWVDLTAPAVSLRAPTAIEFCSSGYGVANGTSFAAPAVAAAGALLAKVRPELSTDQRFAVLRNSARDVSFAGRDDETGFGVLDVAAALGAAAPAPEKSPEIDDDPFYVRGPFAAAHPTLLARARTGKVAGTLSPAKDPADVYPVLLKKGERFVASAVVSGKDAVIELGVWRPSVGDFDVSKEATKQRVLSTGGFAVQPRLTMKVAKTGTYFVSVEATDVVDEDDPEAIPLVTEPYQLSVSRQKIKKSKKPVTKKKKRKKSAKSAAMLSRR
jgi:hypothetical protein